MVTRPTRNADFRFNFPSLERHYANRRRRIANLPWIALGAALVVGLLLRVAYAHPTATPSPTPIRIGCCLHWIPTPTPTAIPLHRLVIENFRCVIQEFEPDAGGYESIGPCGPVVYATPAPKEKP